jgi:hypothetical protein
LPEIDTPFLGCLEEKSRAGLSAIAPCSRVRAHVDGLHFGQSAQEGRVNGNQCLNLERSPTYARLISHDQWNKPRLMGQPDSFHCEVEEVKLINILGTASCRCSIWEKRV